MVVLAPTGIAAINAGYRPFIRSSSFLFRLTFRQQPSEAANRNAISSANSSETSSEASTCWSSMKNQYGAQRFARRHRRCSPVPEAPDLPFGGVQLLMIGDLQQLTVQQEQLLKSPSSLQQCAESRWAILP